MHTQPRPVSKAYKCHIMGTATMASNKSSSDPDEHAHTDTLLKSWRVRKCRLVLCCDDFVMLSKNRPYLWWLYYGSQKQVIMTVCKSCLCLLPSFYRTCFVFFPQNLSQENSTTREISGFTKPNKLTGRRCSAWQIGGHIRTAIVARLRFQTSLSPVCWAQTHKGWKWIMCKFGAFSKQKWWSYDYINVCRQIAWSRRGYCDKLLNVDNVWPYYCLIV